MKKRILVFFLTVCIFITLLVSPYLMNIVKAEISDKPYFTISDWNVTPNPAMKGEPITVNGKINPSPFEMQIPEKDIVLVIDVSGSMKDNIKGKRITKIQALKDAANNFIESLKNEDNLKIAIITFSANANIETKHNNQYYYDVKDKNLKTIIDGLSANGGTNAGEGLRKAAYILSQLPSSNNRSVVFMSDGQPTYYSIGNEVLPYYKKITSAYTKTATAHQVQYSDDWWGKYISWEEKYKIISSEHYVTTEAHYEIVNRQKKWIEEKKELVKEKSEDKKESGWYKWWESTETVPERVENIPEVTENIGDNKSIEINYTNLDDTNPRYKGTGSDDSEEYCKEYAKQIGAILKTNVNNVFSIGYGLDNDGNYTLNEIHQSMGGNNNSYYKTSDNIDGIFKQISSELLKKYTMNNVKLSMTLNTNFSLDVGGNKIDIPAIEYNLVEGSISNGKARYEANPVEFSFIISGNENTENTDLFDDAEVEFDWNDKPEPIKIKVDTSPKITIRSNLLPEIKAELKSPAEVNKNEGEEAEIQYNINPMEFNYAKVNNKDKKEAVILIDTSKNMDQLDKFKNGIINSFVNAIADVDGNNSNLLLHLITYDSKVTVKTIEPDAVDNNGIAINYKNELQNAVNSISVSNTDERRLGEALDKAKDLLDHSSKDTVKNIVIIGEGNPTDKLSSDFTNTDYNVITLGINKTAESGNEFSELKSIHESINGKTDNYFCSYNNDSHNDIQNTISKEMAERLDGLNRRVFNITDVTLNFDLGENLEYVDTSLECEGAEASIVGSKLTIDLPTIKYYLTGNVLGDGRYKYTSDSFTCKFKIKKLANGEVKFLNPKNVNYNNISYTKISGENEKEPIDTPILKNKVADIIHGVYDGNGSIDNSNTRSFTKGTVVPMAAKFIYSSPVVVSLSTDKCELYSVPVIYKKNGNSFTKVGDFTSISEGYVESGVFSGDEIYILYSIKLQDKYSSVNKKDNICTSTLNANGVNFEASVSTVDGQLPDLF